MTDANATKLLSLADYEAMAASLRELNTLACDLTDEFSLPDSDDLQCDADPLCSHTICHACGCILDKRRRARAVLTKLGET